MTQLRADKLLPELLGILTGPVDLVDAEGQVLGRFIPDPACAKRFWGRADDLPPVEEIARQLNTDGPSCTTRQLFEHLLTLTGDPTERAQLEELIKQRAGEEAGCPSQ